MPLASLATLALLALVAASPTAAAAEVPSTTTQPSSPDTVTVKRFDIPAQPLAQAIAAYRQQSSIDIEIDSPGLTLAGSSHAVAGDYTAAQALRQILAGTGLIAEFRDEWTAVLRPAPQRTPQTLAPVEIIARPRAGYATSRTTTATRTPTLLRDVPQSVSIISGDLMKDLSVQSMADVVRYVPGVTMGQGEGNRDQPTIRGNNTTADFFVDGVRDDAQYFRDIYNIDRVEVLKGSNAMVFGRGGGGGVLNRVTKEANGIRQRELTLQGGSFDNKRASIDVGDGLGQSVAGRMNGMLERSGSFRNGVTIERYGINPTLTLAADSRRTRITLGYELFSDRRTADRGIPSFEGRPIGANVTTFFGDPDASRSDARSHMGMVTVTHDATSWMQIRNRTQAGAYDKFYQNVYPGAVTPAGDRVTISAYNNDTRRENLFNQTDVTVDFHTGAVGHTLLIGAEVGRQATDNRRLTGYFNNTTGSVSVPLADPTISIPITFRPDTTRDADDRITNTTSSVYVQDQIEVSRYLQLIAGVRYEQFDLRYRNNRLNARLPQVNRMISPRAGIVVKPVTALSFYGSHSVSHLPSSGDQFLSLTEATKGLEPERFTNNEVGAKWDATHRLALSAAVYRLDRTNTRAPHPHPDSATRVVQTGSQRTSGFEVSAAGNITSAWEIVGAYANQRARVTSRTTVALPGAVVPLVPRTTLSLWNRYQIITRLGVGIGVVHRGDMFAAIDDKVTLPGYTDVDAAVYLDLARNLRAQANIEKIFDVEYYTTAHNNNNISPGSRRAVRVSLTTRF